MKIYKYITSVAILSFCFLSACNKPTETKIPVPVIFDTDVGNDIDDVLAMQMLFNYENAGTIDLLGITISKSNPYSIEYIDGYCRLNERGDIPLGYAYNGATPEDGGYLRQTLDTIIEGNKILYPQRSIKDNLPEGYKLLRKLLASQPDNSVVFIAVGPETNLSRLLRSEADEYSPLDGKSLVAQKSETVVRNGRTLWERVRLPRMESSTGYKCRTNRIQRMAHSGHCKRLGTRQQIVVSASEYLE